MAELERHYVIFDGDGRESVRIGPDPDILGLVLIRHNETESEFLVTGEEALVVAEALTLAAADAAKREDSDASRDPQS